MGKTWHGSDLDQLAETLKPVSGSRLEYLLANARRSRLSVTEAEIEHARHVDTCRTCQGDAESLARTYAENAALDSLRMQYAGELVGLKHALDDAGDAKVSAASLARTVSKILDRTNRAAHKARSGGGWS